jgi:hypothetical protein
MATVPSFSSQNGNPDITGLMHCYWLLVQSRCIYNIPILYIWILCYILPILILLFIIMIPYSSYTKWIDDSHWQHMLQRMFHHMMWWSREAGWTSMTSRHVPHLNLCSLTLTAIDATHDAVRKQWHGARYVTHRWTAMGWAHEFLPYPLVI